MNIRPATLEDAEGIALVRVASWQLAYRGIIPDSALDAMDAEALAKRWRETVRFIEDWLVAVDGDEVIGFAALGQNRFPEMVTADAELGALYLSPAWLSKGIGKALLKSGVSLMLDRGYKSMAVTVLRDNFRGTRFYKDLGAEFIKAGEFDPTKISCPEEWYVWPSLEALSRKLNASS